MAKRKFYVVWEGRHPGIYDNWPDALQQVENWKGAKYKSYTSLEDATEAFRSGDGAMERNLASILLFEAEQSEAGKQHPQAVSAASWQTNPAVDRNAIAVDAACSGNPGDMEYRGVDLATGKEIFHVGPLPGGTNNIGEYLAIVHALALMGKKGINRPVYTDSRTGLSWIRRRKSNTKIKPGASNARVLELLRRADIWVATHSWPNAILKWDTDNWGEIPADFGRK